MSFELNSEATTRGTDFDGARHTAYSEWSSVTAPDGHVINHNEVQVHTISANGSENRHEIQYDHWVEVVPNTGLKFPRTIRVQTYARSPKGMGNVGRGWTKVKVTGNYVKFSS